MKMLFAFCALLSLCLGAVPAAAQPAGGSCKPISDRTAEIGCWIFGSYPMGAMPQAQMFWYLDTFATRKEAEGVKGAHGTVLESLGRVWLLTIETAGWRSSNKAERVAEIGPLPVTAGESYSAQYMEAIFAPGMTAPPHVHSGPEAWYTAAGETCLETPEGIQVGRAGGKYVIVPGGPPMHLTATGHELRRSLVLILHHSTQPATTLVNDWKPKGLCKEYEKKSNGSVR